MQTSSRRCAAAVAGLLIAALAGPQAALAATVPEGFVDREIARGFTSPTSLTVLPDGRVLVVEQRGIVRMIKGDTLLDTPFHTVANVDSFAERGCMGVVPDPDFGTNRHVYLFCTVRSGSNSHNRILRVTAQDDVVAPGSERVILDLPNVPADVKWHMGGAMRFGPDGMLYVAVGNHEDFAVYPPGSSFSQNLSSPFGKILRIHRDGSFPADNPFVDVAGAYRGNWALGLRNPYQMDVQPLTGLIYINDVGASTAEEINRGEAGANYGWPYAEGRTDDPRFTNPVHEYGRDMGCAITAGAFYNPPVPQFPASYIGKYLFTDFCRGWIRLLDPANPAAGSSDFVTGIGNPTALGVAPDGSLYYLARNQDTYTGPAPIGSIGKIVFTNSQAPRLSSQPQSQTIFLGEPVTFSVTAEGAISYQWRRNGTPIAGATSPTYRIAATSLADDQAAFSVVVTNDRESVTSADAVLTVTTNRPPTATIESPGPNAGFAPGEPLSYAGSATDPEDGPLPPQALTWRADFMHDTHSHPYLPATTGQASGTLDVPAFEADEANTWLRLTLTATDSAGQTNTAIRDVFPRTQLSDLTPVGAPLNGSGPIERDRNNGGPAANDGGPMMLDGIRYPKGLGVHAPSEIVFDLGGVCTGAFVSDVGIDDAAGNAGSVAFQVFVDGKPAFDSGIVRGSDPRRSVNVSVSGARQLRLVVTDGGDGNELDVANWAGARVTGCPGPDAGTGPAVGNPADAPTVPFSRSGGGFGCSIGGGNGRIDPMLPGMLAIAIGWIAWRRRNRRPTEAGHLPGSDGH
jgi:glucose/arabinose dehydrogenase